MTQGTITRLAPSPTGALHLGNARTFLANALLAEQNGWEVRMRIEDLDTPRTKPNADRQALEVLRWMGLTWSGEVLYQSTRNEAYRNALEYLLEQGLAYPCICSRRDIQRAASAPARSDGLTCYPGSCRGKFTSAEEAEQATGVAPAWRLRVPEATIKFTDAFYGPQETNLATTSGDVVIFRKEGMASYQLAVTLDDDLAGIDAIVRGEDLLSSAAIQIYLRRVLGFSEKITWVHLPLVRGEDGLKLAKRHGDTRLVFYRDSGVPIERLYGLLGRQLGCWEKNRDASWNDLANHFDLTRVSKNDVTFTTVDHQFLLG